MFAVVQRLISLPRQWRRKQFRSGGQVEADIGAGVLGEGAAPHQLGVWGSAVSSPSGVPPTHSGRIEGPENAAGGCKYHLFSVEQHCH